MPLHIRISLLALLLTQCIMLHAEAAEHPDSCNTPLRPSFGMEYTTELQTDFHSSKWANLLHLSGQLPLSRNLSFDVGSISVASTKEESLVDDLQGFSNIEEANLPLALTVACLEWRIGSRHTIYAGIRRTDEDYFCSDGLALFTNSSCGIFPTVSLNHDIGVFPNAAVGVHYAYDSERIAVNASLYNGRGNNRFSGRNNVFRFCPGSDGLFALAQLEYRNQGSSYFLGGSMHYGDEYECSRMALSPSLWTYAEQSCGDRLTLLAAYSHAFGRINSSQDMPAPQCRNFAAIGGIYAFGDCSLGLFTDYTKVDDLHEFATELTCDIPLSSIISLQPTMHIITTGGTTKSIGMMRMTICL